MGRVRNLYVYYVIYTYMYIDSVRSNYLTGKFVAFKKSGI